MGKRTGNRYSYTALLACSMVVAAFVQITGFARAETNKNNICQKPMMKSAVNVNWVPGADNEMSRGAEPANMATNEPIKESLNGAVNSSSNRSEDELSNGSVNELMKAVQMEGNREPAVFQADTSYFDDALFIGDSRTVGLSEYGDLGNAEVVADSGMNVHEIFDKRFVTRSGEKKSLEEILSEGQFGKIYLMLGINELGYDFDYTVAKYGKLIEKLREAQPDALIFLQANLHVTARKSAASDIYNNENIDRFNQAVRQMADNRKLFYLDVNELFDDEEGNLSEDYTADNAHVLGKYYADWVEWMLEHAYR